MVNTERKPGHPHPMKYLYILQVLVFRKGDLKEKIIAPMIWERSSYRMIYSEVKLNLILRKIQAGECGFSITPSADTGHNPKI